MNRAERRRTGTPKHPSVIAGYLYGGDVSGVFMASLIRCRDYELMRTQMLFGLLERRARSLQIPFERNNVTAAFLATDAEYLWMIDADMGCPETALQQLLAVADPKDRPIVGALCFALRGEGYDEETNAELFGTIPTLYMFNKDEDGNVVNFSSVEDYPRGQTCRVHSTGAACVLIHRSVLERMRDEYGDNWWTQIPQPDKVASKPFGEDTSFFIRADEMGVPLWVNTAVRTSHDKGGVFLTEQVWDAQNEQRARLAQYQEAITALPTFDELRAAEG